MSYNNRSRPEPSFAHLRRLTDDTGLLEHALGRVPRRREGYTTDDNARALWTMTEWLALASHRKKTETSDGTVEARTESDGTAGRRTAGDGVARDGVARDGVMIDDAARDGTVRDGTARDGSAEIDVLATETPDGDGLAGTLSNLAEIYMAFMLWSQHDDGWWHNNIAYDRTPEPEELSHDCQGRAFWACADAWVRLEGPLRETARIMIEKSLQTVMRIDSLRGRAFAMAACAHLLDAGESGAIELPDDWRQLFKQQMNRLEQMMNEAFRRFTDESWRWFEPAMTYSNGVLAWALLRTYRVTKKPETLKNGLDSLSWLLDIMTVEEGWLRPIGNDGWCTNETISQWDQQPLEMFKLALALEEAALAVEAARYDESRLVASGVSSSARLPGGNDSAKQGGPRLPAGLAGASWPGLAQSHRGSDMTDTRYLRKMRNLCLDWFYGDNDLQVPMIDRSDGSCCDGLAEHGPNLNCGAEAVISYLMTEAICRRDLV